MCIRDRIHVYTHDSIGLGEDGPTHQPVEHVASLRMIPGLDVWRPCDKAETAVAWREALVRRKRPTALVLTRQGLAHQPRDGEQLAAIATGGYVLRDSDRAPEVVVIATGSEVGISVEAAETLAADGIAVRVVSMPLPERFLAQPDDWREKVLPAGVPRLAVEAGVSAYWRGLVGDRGRVIGIDGFGASAPAGDLFRHFDLTADRVVREVREMLGR